ncbi:histidinol dehydrogenase [Gordonia bronchialis DSM 43247]|uniref:Histidinol dehydrogenase n=1 Tax=Gordonia bronchialis (strain ATCC 25592 / DSM 43247 / BCRC 13721 / JCM 3198 / KCTC 3076 / NBRC 16047 / NCTC 10667) TaxID=526226 RepID=D0LA03_GORB4|nr:histidinol dehydrogenase [Gordonia bronchialis]ACY22168.1 histidinol dehydrogenase [Gordonia bronchialis DSM 43247]MCC3324959.1 histidinol dehydrogenase [Gordonia bronchialis]QGS24282.1 histidinol dehydrogenase [Gordonia bronchialis]STQ65092.1 Histidinol dehydrogenase [Gordonia bronchialis]
MLARTDLRGSTPTLAQLRRALPRGGTDVNAVLDTVEPVVHAVAEHGVEAALSYGERFDGVRPASVRVPADAISEALERLDPAIADALRESITRARKVHADQRRETTRTQVVDGGVVSEKWIPVRRVGLYVPGGNAVYPSSVIMNVVPAQEAGVGSLVVASPPQKDFGGWPHPTILAACALLGVDEVWAVGGAQGIALLTYGGEETDGSVLDPVDLITGPGNIYVTAAKRLCRGVVGIDSEAGPTEIAILADDSADAGILASDLISQAEHDVLAASVLVTDSAELADAVDAALEQQVAATKHRERVTTALSGEQSGIVLVDDLEAGLAVVDAYAAEHLEIQTRDAATVADRVHNAGAIFVGPYAPVSLGDYCAGSNHVLPTSGSARFASGLSVQTFLKGVHVIDYDEAALRSVADKVVTLADAEDLPGHGDAVTQRFGGGVA